MNTISPDEMNLLAHEILHVRERGGDGGKAVEEWCEERRLVFTTELLTQAMALADARAAECEPAA